MSIPYIFLLGAGASKKAGIPLIDEMTKNFEKELPHIVTQYIMYHHNEFDAKFIESLSMSLSKIKNSIQKSSRKFDVEILLEALTKLSDQNEIFHIIRPEKKDTNVEVYSILKSLLMKHIRETCEKIEDVTYLYPLKVISE